jgi:hypothetical protein
MTVDQSNVGTAADAANTSTLVIPATNPVAAGAWIFIGGVANAVTVISALGSSITWIVDSTSATTGAFTSLIRGYAASGVAAGGTLATLTYSGSDTGKIAVASSLLGLDAASPLDTVGTSTTGNSQAWASASMTPQSGGVIIATTGYWSSGGVSDGGTNTATSPSVELNNLRSLNTDDEVVLSYRLSAGTVAGTFSTSATTWNCAAATYKAAAGAGPAFTPHRMPLGV